VFITGGVLRQVEADYIKGSRRPTLQKPVELAPLNAMLDASDSDSTPPSSVRTLSEPGDSERPTLHPSKE